MHSDYPEERDGVQSLFIRMTHLYFGKIFQQLSSSGVHPGQLPMIKLLGKQGGLSQKEIAQRLKTKPPTVTVSLRRMENAGFIERRPDEKDQRVTRIYLSPGGMDIYEKMNIMLEHNEKCLLKGFTESEVCLVQRFLKQMLENLENIPAEGFFDREKKG